MTRGRAARTASFTAVGQRAAIVAAGPIANFILAIVIFAGDLHVLRQADRPRRASTASSRTAPPRQAGFQPGDLVVAIDGQPIESFADMQRIVSTSAGQQLAVVVERGGAQARR